MAVKLVVIALLVAVLIALFSGLYTLSRANAEDIDRTRLVRRLTWRIGLSIALFILLLVAFRMGWIQSQ